MYSKEDETLHIAIEHLLEIILPFIKTKQNEEILLMIQVKSLI